MKKLKSFSVESIYLCLGLGLLNTSAFSKDVDLKTDLAKGSYYVGLQIGNSMKNQGVEVDTEVVAQAIDDVLKGTAPRLTEDEMTKGWQKIQDKAHGKQEELGKKNKEEGDKFLAENKKRKGVIETKTGLQYEVVKDGTGKMPTDKSKVKVHYKGTLTNGTEFDSSYKRDKPAEFTVSGVIQGWTEALKMMKAGSTWDLVIPSNLAYGATPTPGIPANSVLKFRVELLEVQD